MSQTTETSHAAYTSTAVTFTHRGAQLVGSILTPKGQVPQAAVVLLPGHGTRTSSIDVGGTFSYLLSPLGEPLAESGFLVLNYARPGTGGSEGDWRFQTLYDRADEALAAVDFLRQQTANSGLRIGVAGHSNGGWVAPLAASLSSEIDFVIALAGPAVLVSEQGRFAMHTKLTQSGASPQDHESADALFREYIELLRHLLAGRRTEFERIRAELPGRYATASHAVSASGFSDFPTWEDRDDVRNSMDAMIDYDPLVALRKVSCPVLAVFGDKDPVLDSSASAELFRQALREGGNRNFTVETIPNGGHGPWPNTSDLVCEWLSRYASTIPE